MAIPAWLFFSAWAIISLTFLKLGFNALDRADHDNISNSLSIFLLKHALAISLCHASHYAFHFRPHLKVWHAKYYFWAGNALNPLVLFGPSALGIWYFPYAALFNIFAVVKEREVTAAPGDRFGLQIDFLVKLSMYYINGGERFFPTWVVVISVYTSAVWAVVFDNEELMRAAKERENPMINPGENTAEHTAVVLCAIFAEKESSSAFKKTIYRRRELVHFGIGMVGTILFQYLFRLTTFDHVVAFLYISVAWLGNLALLCRTSGDLGIFNFLLANVIVGCTVSQFGIRGTTWIAFGASVFLYGLRLEIQKVSLINSGEVESRVSV